MRKKRIIPIYLGIILILLLILSQLFSGSLFYDSPRIHIYCEEANDLFQVLETLEGVDPIRYDSLEEMMDGVDEGEAIMVLADNYPEERLQLSDDFFNRISDKNLRFYLEFTDGLPGIAAGTQNVTSKYRRAIINSSFFKNGPDSLDILAINGLTYIPTKIPQSHMMTSSAAGAGQITNGLKDIPTEVSKSNMVAGRAADLAHAVKGLTDIATKVTGSDLVVGSAAGADQIINGQKDIPVEVFKSNMVASRGTDLARAVKGSTDIPTKVPESQIVAGRVSESDHSINGVKVSQPLIVIGRVAGLDHAVYGLPEETDPLLFKVPGYSGLVATTGLSHFIKGRYAPASEWQGVWKGILEYLLPDKRIDKFEWEAEVQTSYTKQQTLPQDYQRKSIERAIAWYHNAKMLIPDNYDQVIQMAFDSKINTGFISWSDTISSGNGSNGVFECIFSKIDETGNQPIGIVRRGDCTAEAAGAFAAAGKALGVKQNYEIANNLLEYYLEKSPATKGQYGDTSHGAYGLAAWGIENDAWFKANYGDDNARLLLGAFIATAITGKKDLDPKLMRILLAQVRTTGKNGFRGDRIDLPQFEANGWQHFYERDIVNLSPHMEAYLWACFLWAYHKTGDPIFLERTKKAIKTTMDNYPHGWKWMNGLAQERARILLPLAWLVRIENTPENREMLNVAVEGLLDLQDESGAIWEELGNLEKGVFPPTRKNEDYGLHEASLIARNGDPVSDLLYTTNFAFLGLHEAWYSSKDPRVKEAADKLAEFLCRIQVKSPNHPELNGGWMRAFDFRRFEHWGSNADAGWGAWAIETGWTQGWITTILSLREMNTSVWDLTKNSEVGEHHQALKKEMFSKE
nr:hypothetical protein [Allomuricauda sp.]